MLEVLKQYDIPEVKADIIRRIESSDPSMNVKYIVIAGEMRLQEAFKALSAIFLNESHPARQWTESALVSINPNKARAFALSVVKVTLYSDLWSQTLRMFSSLTHNVRNITFLLSGHSTKP